MYEQRQPTPSGPGPVLRLTVEMRDDTWKIRNTTVVDRMTVPASQGLPDPGRAGRVSGLWFEVVDDSGAVRYRSIMAEPVPAVEVHQRDGSFARVPAPKRVHQTDVRVPLLPEGSRFRLFHEPSVRPSTHGGAEPPSTSGSKGGPARVDADPVLDLNLDTLKEG